MNVFHSFFDIPARVARSNDRKVARGFISLDERGLGSSFVVPSKAEALKSIADVLIRQAVDLGTRFAPNRNYNLQLTPIEPSTGAYVRTQKITPCYSETASRAREILGAPHERASCDNKTR